MPTLLTTDAITHKERPHYWNYLVSNVLGRLNTIPTRKQSFNGSITYSHLAHMPIAEVSSSQLKVIRPSKFIQDPNEDFYKINFQLAGHATLTQNKRQAQLEPGQWIIYDNSRPYELNFHGKYEQLLFLVPRSQLINRFPAIDLRLVQAHSSQSGMGKLLFQFVQNALTEGDLLAADSKIQTSQMILDLLLLAVTENSSSAIDSSRPLPGSARLLQIKTAIDQNLHNPNLSVDLIAKKLHLSKRTIQKLFAKENNSVNRYIWIERIKRCKQDLADPRLINQPIQDIAFSWGFKSGAHFSRMFKDQVGQAPSAFRQAQIDALNQP